MIYVMIIIFLIQIFLKYVIMIQEIMIENKLEDILSNKARIIYNLRELYILG